MDEKEMFLQKLKSIKKYIDFLKARKSIFAFFSILLIASILIYPFIKVPTLQFSSFKGSAEDYNFDGQNSIINFKAKQTALKINETLFKNVKNITVEINGKQKSIDYASNIYIKYNSDVYQPLWKADRVDINLFFKNLTMKKSLDEIILNGYIEATYPNELKSTGGEVMLNKGWVDYVTIDREKFVDFDRISFEIDNSSIYFISKNISLLVYGASDLKIISQLSRLTLIQGEGTLELRDHLFDIKGANILSIIILPYQENFFSIEDTKVRFYGFAKFATLNTEDIIMSDLYYWLKKQPEKINAYAVVILVILTGWYAYSTKSMLTEQTKKRKIEAIEKKLERVYSPINNALIEFKLEPLPDDKIPDIYDQTFRHLKYTLFDINMNYGHLFDVDAQKCCKEVFESWKRYSSEKTSIDKTLTNYKNLNESIEKFHKIVKSKIEKERELHNNLQS